MPSGELLVVRNALTTFSRFRARVLRWPLPFWMVSFRASASAAMSKVSRRFLIASAPIAPSKYMPNLSTMDRYSASSPSRSVTLRFLKRSKTLSMWAISASTRLRTWAI